MKTVYPSFTTSPLPPARDISGWEHVPIVESHEPLVALEDAGFLVEHVYYDQGVPGSLPQCLARQGVVERLLQARALLPASYNFLIWDAYRPLQVQAFLFNRYKAQLRRQYPHLSEEALNRKTETYLTLPSTDPTRPSPHNTGAALDLTLAKEGVPLDMGTPFDHFDREATPDFFENATDPHGLQIRNNRRFFFHILSAAGFKNYPYEWWHWSYGDQMACVGTGKPAIYGGIGD
jgi:D-alanyl-D-alanine dipeptidase